MFFFNLKKTTPKEGANERKEEKMENWWLIWAVGGLALWALANVLDNYFTEDSYLDEYTGLAISALFNFFPVVFILLFISPEINRAQSLGLLAAFSAGILLMTTYLAYFKCLFSLNDNVALQVAWGLSSPLILLWGKIFLGDDLTSLQYTGAGLILLGVLFLDFRKFSFAGRGGMVSYLFWALLMNLAYSSQQILMKVAYEIEKIPFWTAFLYFTLGQLLVGLVSVFLRWKIVANQRAAFVSMIKRFWIVFIVAEIVEQMAALSTQKAVEATPYISFYGALEAGMPVYVLFVGLGVSVVLRIPWFNKKEVGEIIWDNFKAGLSRKLLATVFVVVGVFLLT